MEETNKQQSKGQNREWCPCPNCGAGNGYGYGHHHFLLRWILGLIILGMVFWMGVKIGEFKEFFKGNFEPYWMDYHRSMMFPEGYKMWTTPSPAPPQATTPQK